MNDVDEALRQIGLIAIGAAAAEMNLARLASNASDGLTLEKALRLPNREKAKRVRTGLAIRRNMTGAEKSDEARRRRAVTWADEAVELLRLRGNLMHSEWILARATPDRRASKQWLRRHLSTGDRSPVDASNLAVLAEKLEDCNRRFHRIELAAWRLSGVTFTSEAFDSAGRLRVIPPGD